PAVTGIGRILAVRQYSPASMGATLRFPAPTLRHMSLPKQFLLGRPLSTSQMSETLLPKRLALPVFCSDPLSSVAYATEEILLILALGGAGLLHLTWYVGAVIVVLLIVVVASYRQTCYAYPNGGGAYVVSSENLGETAA